MMLPFIITEWCLFFHHDNGYSTPDVGWKKRKKENSFAKDARERRKKT